MKNLFTKTLLLGGLAGNLVLGGCGDKKEFTGEIYLSKQNYRQTGWNIYCLTNNKDSLLVGSNTLVNPFNEGDSVRIEYKFSEGKEDYWEKKDNSGQLKEQEYSMNKLLSYQILKKHENKNSELEKFNLENKQVYQDFVSFFKENKDKDGFYFNKTQSVAVQIPEDHIWIYIDTEKKQRCFNDYGFNGMDALDLYKGNKGKEFIEDMPPEKQLEVAKEYKVLLTGIMHEAKYKNY